LPLPQLKIIMDHATMSRIALGVGEEAGHGGHSGHSGHGEGHVGADLGLGYGGLEGDSGGSGITPKRGRTRGMSLGFSIPLIEMEDQI